MDTRPSQSCEIQDLAKNSGISRKHENATHFPITCDTCSKFKVDPSPVLTYKKRRYHYNDVIMNPMASQITSLTSVYSTVYSGTDQRKHQSFASLAFVLGIHRWPVNSPHKGPVTRKMFPFDDVIMETGHDSMDSIHGRTHEWRTWNQYIQYISARPSATIMLIRLRLYPHMNRDYSGHWLSQWQTNLHCLSMA